MMELLHELHFIFFIPIPVPRIIRLRIICMNPRNSLWNIAAISHRHHHNPAFLHAQQHIELHTLYLSLQRTLTLMPGTRNQLPLQLRSTLRIILLHLIQITNIFRINILKFRIHLIRQNRHLMLIVKTHDKVIHQLLNASTLK